MKNIILWVIIYVLSTAIHAQNINLEWAKSMGGIQTEWGKSITTDTMGNVYITGGFHDSVDFDPDTSTFYLKSNGAMDIFIVKLNENGSFIWAKSFGGASRDEVFSFTLDANGNVYITGYFIGTVDFDPGPSTLNLTSNGDSDAYIVKLDSRGNINWATSFGQARNDWGGSVTIDTLGHVYVAGTFRDTVDFDPGPDTFNLISNAYDAFILKLDANGNFIWAKSFGGTRSDHGISVTTKGMSNVYVGGSFNDTVDFDPGPTTFNLIASGLQNNSDAYILKLDSGGNFVWAKSMGGNQSEILFSITTDGSGNIYSTGRFGGTADFDPGPATFNLFGKGNSDFFVLKLEAGGSFIWAKSTGGKSGDNGQTVTTDLLGNVYVTGLFSDTVDFDPGTSTFNLISKGVGDGFVQKLDGNGNLIWAGSIGGTNMDHCKSITVDASENVYVTGQFYYIADADPSVRNFNLRSKGNGDAFALKLSKCGFVTGTDVITACDSYTWIDGNTYTLSNNSATFTSTNVNGCDSVSTIDLTIDTVDVSVTTNDPSITANATGVLYQWLDCTNNYSPIIGDTAQSFTATVNGRYAVEVTQKGCTDTSNCITISTIGIEKNVLFNDVQIYPNPNEGLVIIDLGDLKEISIRVFNAGNQLIYQEDNITHATHQFDLKAAPGVYIIELSTQGEKQQYKLVRK